MGGAGKTPAAIAVAQILDGGRTAAVHAQPRLWRRARRVRSAVDPARHRSADVGDEPLLLARFAPTIVARDRAAGADAARAAGAGSIVMDDGFQNPALHKDRSILVVDGRRGIGNGKVFPAGPLRAPLESQLRRADALLVVGAGAAGEAVAARGARACRCSTAGLSRMRRRSPCLKGRPVLAFAGIGDPEKFFATLRDAGIEIGAAVPFPDHHRYRRFEARELIERAGREGLVPVTTEKDLARLAGQDDLAALAAITRALPVTLQVAEDRRVPGVGAYLTCCGCNRRITASGEA